MGVKLDDILGNNKQDILVDKSKRTVNILMALISVVVIMIVIVAFMIIKKNDSTKKLREIKEKIADAVAIGEAVKSLEPSEYLGERQDSKDVKTPITLNNNGQVVEYKYGYYYVSADEANKLVPTLFNKKQNYIINYTTGEVVNVDGIQYNGKLYHDLDDFLVIQEKMSNPKSKSVTPSSYTVYIREAADLLKINAHPDYIYKLTQDIDMKAVLGDTGDGWEPLTTLKYGGVLDGRGYTISNLYINRQTSYGNCGLFKEVESGAKVRNLVLKEVSISGGNYVGAIAGTFAGEAFNCSVSGTINGTGYVGGAFGSFTGKAEKMVCSVTVNGMGDNVGGFAGYITTGDLKQVAVKSTTLLSTASNVGGIAGYITPHSDISMAQCLVKDTNIRAIKNIGGFIGNFAGIESAKGLSVTDSYVNRTNLTPNVNQGSAENVGGFAGMIDTTGRSTIKITRVYSAASLVNPSAIENKGGFIGKFAGKTDAATIRYCYWLKGSLEAIESVGSFDEGFSLQSAFYAYSAEQLRTVSEYKGWTQADFVLWNFDGRNPPTLNWER
jgi:hypothetical protein